MLIIYKIKLVKTKNERIKLQAVAKHVGICVINSVPDYLFITSICLTYYLTKQASCHKLNFTTWKGTYRSILFFLYNYFQGNFRSLKIDLHAAVSV